MPHSLNVSDIEDAYWLCCGLKFRDKQELFNHQLDSIEVHRGEILRHLWRGRLVWLFLYRQSPDLHTAAQTFVDEELAKVAEASAPCAQLY